MPPRQNANGSADTRCAMHRRRRRLAKRLCGTVSADKTRTPTFVHCTRCYGVLAYADYMHTCMIFLVYKHMHTGGVSKRSPLRAVGCFIIKFWDSRYSQLSNTVFDEESDSQAQNHEIRRPEVKEQEKRNQKIERKIAVYS